MPSSRLLVALMVVPLLAGCSTGGGDGGGGDVSGGSSNDLGSLRGTIVDEAVRPLEGATVRVTMALESRNLTTDEKGTFRFDDLEPGTWLVAVERAGFLPVQSTAVVQAGRTEYVQLQVMREVGGDAFYVERKIEGFLECYVGAANACFMANYYPCVAYTLAGQACSNVTNDNSYFVISEVLDLQRVPDWTQSELVWEPVQPQFPYMMLRMDIFLEPPFVQAANSTYGASPLMTSFDADFAEDNELGLNTSLGLESFSYGNDQACDADPDIPNDFVDELVSTCYATVLVNQDITYFTHIFYGYTPPDGWRFTDEETVPAPPR